MFVSHLHSLAFNGRVDSKQCWAVWNLRRWCSVWTRDSYHAHHHFVPKSLYFKPQRGSRQEQKSEEANFTVEKKRDQSTLTFPLTTHFPHFLGLFKEGKQQELETKEISVLWQKCQQSPASSLLKLRKVMKFLRHTIFTREKFGGNSRDK